MRRSLAALAGAALLLAAPPAAADSGGATSPASAAPGFTTGGAVYDTAPPRPRPKRGATKRRPANGPGKRAPLARRLPRGPAGHGNVAPQRTTHRFPVAGPFTFGGSGSRFGADRHGHKHQGQDMAAAPGTPVVAPWAGVIKVRRYQAAGAGHYVVLTGAGEDRDYVFMHLRAGSIPVRAGQRVHKGEKLGEVGNSGRSFGAHLHFEVWVDGGWYTGGRPIDPLPLLRSWIR